MSNCRIHCEIAAKLNFAAHQSAFPVLRELRVENLHADQRLDDLTLTLRANPPFIQEKTWPVDRIPPQKSVSIEERDLQVDGEFLRTLTESVRGNVIFRVEKAGTLLAELPKPLELLAFNEWGGAEYMPELLAAFSMPNDPAVDRILHKVSEILRQAGENDSIDGYVSRSRQRVWEIASAIYTAICTLRLKYAVPPASFERDGQKIRLPSQLCEGRVATCLDTTMLFASVFEQAGLNPIVALPKGHALVGVWLQPEDLSTIVIDEAETLRKRADLKELVLVETTCVTSHPAPSFSTAIKQANATVLPEADATFVAAVDVRRARSHRITPLGLQSRQPMPNPGHPPPRVEQGLEQAPPLPDFDSPTPEEDAPQTAEGRLKRWKLKLLDLTNRNPLLNHRATKTSLQIICPDPGLLEDKLAAGTRIQIKVVPRPSAQQELYRSRTGEVIGEEYARAELEKTQPAVLVDLPAEELSKHAIAIYRKTQTALQEGGSNTLYLAIGFLLWKRNPKDEHPFRAPLILLPVALEWKSVRSGIRMVAHDDEPRFNTTLLEMLHRDYRIHISGLDEELPTDDSGIDVVKIWDTVRKEVKVAPGFEVVEDVVLGHFSFAKYLMWKDLVDRTDKLRKNSIVQHLLDTPRERYPSEISFVKPSQLDSKYKPSDLLTPLPADSSQMAAIATADRGKDFVIIGPPGTGKSQTIANLIAHLLGTGKTVLFVSEKMAALEVVYRRLKDNELDRFCLELHSNKAQKSAVLKHLGKAWEAVALDTPNNWAEQAEELREQRDRLNRVVACLHKKYGNGLTAHDAMGVKIRYEHLASRLKLSWPSAEQHDKPTLNAMLKAVKNLSIQAAAIGDVTASSFQLVTKSDWSPQWEEHVAREAERLSAAARKGEAACRALGEAVGMRLPDQSMTRLEALGELACLLLDSYRKPTAYALEANGMEQIEALEEAVVRLKAYSKARAALSCAYKPFAWRNLDGAAIGRRWAEAETFWWLKRFFVRRGILKEMHTHGAKGQPDPARDAKTLTRLRQEGTAIDGLDRQLSAFKDWHKHATDPSSVESLRKLGKRARDVTGKLADDPQGLAGLRDKIRNLLRDGNDLLAPEGGVGRKTAAFLATLKALQQATAAFEAIAGASVRETFASSDRALERLRETAETIAARHNELREWCMWRRRRDEAIAVDLLPLVEAVEQGRIPANKIQATFKAAYCTWWSGAVIGADEVLRTFSTPEQTDTIKQFRKGDDRFQKTTARYVAARLASKLPRQDITRSSGWGILRHELQKKKRHKPIRKLLEQAPEALTALAPCFMMSPLSVAQYLPPSQALFDVVIFDEASQITVWDAIGAIARGRQVIVAGDPKQMPPSNFFARSEDDPDGDIDMEGDLESILDEMLGASIPQRTLNLHYRSRKESLIAFSNERYYDNDLVTFPAPDVNDRAVSLVRPEGFYARGGARHNEGEAKAIVVEVVRRLKHSDEAVRKLSIGVVTFNSEQQTLIENLLDKERNADPQIEWAFSSADILEPVFVKNLETVQGDERDVILFSVTYGPDRNDRVTMNFGPLNRQGGERRLNVALTRARWEMIVFSTLDPNRINLSHTQAQAVTDLKHFLQYAERGPAALAEAVSGPGADFESPFETAVARELRQKGWQVHPQVGVSSYRIDLGIVHPNEPGRYLAGIECDGAMYHSSAVARERDKIRQQVLEGLGWKLFRIWSTDWWGNKAKALDELHKKLSLTYRQEGLTTLKKPREDLALNLQGKNKEALKLMKELGLVTNLHQLGILQLAMSLAPEPQTPREEELETQRLQLLANPNQRGLWALMKKHQLLWDLKLTGKDQETLGVELEEEVESFWDEAEEEIDEL